MRNHQKLIAGLAVVGIVVAGGSAFTASNTVAASVAGYGTSTISGATATSVRYTLNGAGTQITAAAMNFDGDLTGMTVKAGFGSDTLTSCTVGTPGLDNPDTLALLDDYTPVTCSGYTQSTASSAS